MRFLMAILAVSFVFSSAHAAENSLMLKCAHGSGSEKQFLDETPSGDYFGSFGNVETGISKVTASGHPSVQIIAQDKNSHETLLDIVMPVETFTATKNPVSLHVNNRNGALEVELDGSHYFYIECQQK